MKFEKVTHYMIDKDDGLPWFKILMSGGKSYISFGLEFVEDTPQNREYLIDVYDCEEYLDELDNSPIDNHDNITDASYMMFGYEEVTEFEFIALNLKDANYIIYGFKKLTDFELVTPNLKNARNMINECDNIENFELVAPPHIMEEYKHLLNKG